MKKKLGKLKVTIYLDRSNMKKIATAHSKELRTREKKVSDDVAYAKRCLIESEMWEEGLKKEHEQLCLMRDGLQARMDALAILEFRYTKGGFTSIPDGNITITVIRKKIPPEALCGTTTESLKKIVDSSVFEVTDGK